MNKDVFRFEINEALYFKRGYEVAEMIGISLDPHISVTPFNDYISIKGYMTLQGDYKKDETENTDNASLDELEFQARRYFENVEENESGLSSFHYQFPIEISVPTYRISDMNDITVEVDEFDYELPNNERLNLTAAILINGIKDDPNVASQLNDIESKEKINDQFEFQVIKEMEESESVTPELDSLLQKKSDQGVLEGASRSVEESITENITAETDEEDVESTELDEVEFVESQVATDDEFSAREEPIEELDRMDKEKEVQQREELPEIILENEENEQEENFEATRKEEEILDNDDENELAQVEESEKIKEKSDDKDRIFFKKETKKLSDYFKELAEKENPEQEKVKKETAADIELEENDDNEMVEEEYDDQSTGPVSEDIHYLTDIFRSVEVEEEFAQMRICIVQENDTLEKIAERYDVSKVQLLKKNRLENGELSEGQLLNIPVQQNSTSKSSE